MCLKPRRSVGPAALLPQAGTWVHSCQSVPPEPRAASPTRGNKSCSWQPHRLPGFDGASPTQTWDETPL